MDEDEVPEEGRILYATPTLLNGVMALDTTKSREVLSAFSVRKAVPQSRFYTAIDLLDGKTAGEEAGQLQEGGNWQGESISGCPQTPACEVGQACRQFHYLPLMQSRTQIYIVKYRK